MRSHPKTFRTKQPDFMDLGAYFREFSNLSLIASQLENVGWGQIGVNFLFLLTVLRVNKFFSGFDILSISTSLLANYRADDS